MLKVLLKKQLYELNRNFFYDQKKGVRRSRASSILLVAAYALLMILVLGGMFTGMALMLCSAFAELDLGWLYYVIFSLLAVTLGVFGSVFNTYSSLYQAKDNDLLLSMPIPVRYIMTARLLGVYLMGLMFSGVVMLPAVVVYLVMTPLTFTGVLGGILLLFLISVVVLILSCALGWCVAKISGKLKNKSFITVILSLVFFGAYYFLVNQMSELLEELIANALTVGAAIQNSAYPVYLLGQAGAGDPLSMLILTAAVLGLFALTWWVLSRSFLRIVTTKTAAARGRYRDKEARARSQSGALVGREFRRFCASPTYMLNCGLGTVILLVAAGALVIKGGELRDTMLSVLPGAGLLAVLAAALVCMIASMNDITSPSVSLEGKTLWIAQSLPIHPWQVLRAKLTVHLLVTGIPVLLCCVCAAVILRPSFAAGLLMTVLPLLYTALSACFGLFLDLRRPNLTWTSEAIPIKQSTNVLFAMFGGWGYALVLGGGFFLLGGFLGAELYLLLFTVLTAGLLAWLYSYLKRKGSVLFAEL